MFNNNSVIHVCFASLSLSLSLLFCFTETFILDLCKLNKTYIQNDFEKILSRYPGTLYI